MLRHGHALVLKAHVFRAGLGQRVIDQSGEGLLPADLADDGRTADGFFRRFGVAAVGKIPAALAGDERRTLAHEAGGVIAVGLARQQHRVQLAQMGGDPFQMVHMASSFTVPAPCP